MTCKFTVTIPAGSIDLTSQMDWFACHAAILDVMGIKDAGPVNTPEAALAIGMAERKKPSQRTITPRGRP